jgi:hypothetical protein
VTTAEDDEARPAERDRPRWAAGKRNWHDGQVTAPLPPPQGQPPQYPQFPGWDTVPEKPGDRRAAVLADVRRGLLVTVLVTVLGVALGLLWVWLSPRIPMVSDGKAIYLKDTEGEEAIGGDGTYVFIALGLGILAAVGVFLRWRRGGIGVVLGLAAGGMLASVVGWRIGVWLGPTSDIIAHAKAVGPKVVFDGPLELRAKSALVAFSVAAMLTHLVLTSGFGEREEPPPVEWQAPPPPPPQVEQQQQ